MNISCTFKNFEASEHLKKYAEKRFGKLARFIGKNTEADLSVIMSVDKHRQKAEVLLTSDGGLNISTSADSSDMYATVDILLDKLEEQVKRFNEKKRAKRTAKRGEPVVADLTPFVSDVVNGEPVLVENNDIEHKPMFPEDAQHYLEESGQEIVVFMNASTKRPSVMYRTCKGTIRLIDTDFE